MPKNKQKALKQSKSSPASAEYDHPIAGREILLELIESQQVPVSQEYIANALGYADENSLEALRRRLQAMVRDGQLFRNRRGGYLSLAQMDLEKGVVQSHPDGFGFVIADSGVEDIFLPSRQMRTLMNGDRVAVKIASFDRRRERAEGALVSVLERAHETLVGRYYRESGIEFVVPDDKRLVQDVLLNREVGHKAKPGDIVLVRITEYPSHRSQPVGLIEHVLGQENAPGMEVTIALNTHNIPHRWNDRVLASLRDLKAKVSAQEHKHRRDLRDLPFVTIDGADAKDFDDAVYCETIQSGFRLFVAIADVAHYVKPDSALDQEACERGTSVYFPGEVVPMLPEVLSNGLCSLNPNVDRLCLVCAMDISHRGAIKRYEFFEAVIHSKARLIYDVVAAWLFAAPSEKRKRKNPLLAHLERLKQVYQTLSAARRRRHAIEFETREVQFRFNQQRKIESIEPVVRNQAHLLIEECMVAANVCAARFLKQHKLPALYRIHEGANVDKLPDLRAFLLGFGIALNAESPTPKDYASVVEQARSRPESEMIQTVVLRSLLQASYSPNKQLGHFGLALKDYAHFTSPIRRYPDLLVHRAIKHWLRQQTVEGYHYELARMHELGESCSRHERRAEDATRDAADWLKCEFLQKHIGQRYDGIVTGVTNFGLFVQLDELLVDGLVHVTSLKRDYYQYDPAGHRLVGERQGIEYRLGDRLRVEVVRVNMEDRKIDFDLIKSLEDRSSKRCRGKTTKKENRKNKDGKRTTRKKRR